MPKTNYERALLDPQFLNPKTGEKMPNDSGWQTRHLQALAMPSPRERGIIEMIRGWASYADHYASVTDGIGKDYVLGVEWDCIGRGLLGLLNGDLGRLDAGTLDSFIRNTFLFEGLSSE